MTRALLASFVFLALGCPPAIEVQAPRFVVAPVAFGLSARQVTLSWATDVPATAVVSLIPAEGQTVSVVVDELIQGHDVLVQGLTPDTAYEARIVAEANGLVAQASLSITTPPAPNKAPFSVLFDAAHGEEAGNADWVIDAGEAIHSPANPTSPEDWDGTISSWGFDLLQTGRYLLETLPEGESITFGADAPRDLSRFDAFVLPEPNRPLSFQERAAVIAFVEAGGGLILVANHAGADRDDDGFDAREIINQLMNDNGRQSDIFGAQFDPREIVTDPATNLDVQQGVPVIDGPFGVVSRIAINNGTTMTLRANGPATPIGWDNGAPRGLTEVLIAVSSFGLGKVFLIGDSSPFEDGTGQPGNDIFDSWNVDAQDNDVMFLNATAFVVGDEG